MLVLFISLAVDDQSQKNTPVNTRPIWDCLSLAWRILLVVLFDGLGIWITHCKFVNKTNGKSQSSSVYGSHCETLKGGHTGVVTWDSLWCHSSYRPRSKKSLIVINNSACHFVCGTRGNKRKKKAKLVSENADQGKVVLESTPSDCFG